MTRPSKPRWRRLPALLLAACLSLASGAATAEVHALLIGVGQVKALPKRLWLRGPANDVHLMRSYLQERGVQRITALGLDPAGPRASHAAITSAMQLLLEGAQVGDQVVLHLAGHGVQVPQRPGAAAEADGLDEVFLAEDTRPWSAATGTLPQGLYDHDLAHWMDALAAKGVRVFAVLDTCHAAGMQRAASTAQRWRGVAAAELGVPPMQRATTPTAAWTGGTGQKTAANRIVAMAARAHESTPEEWLPKGAPNARVHGVFSAAVVQALRDGAADATALRRALQRAYRAANRASPVPVVLGSDALSLP